ncbi:MAG: small ribosomal subunit Rsm22 family protein [Chlamydiota bacterium]
MKRKSANLHPEWDIIFPHLIGRWRKLMKLPLGPEDRLQTREFQSLIQDFLAYRESNDLSSKESLGAYLLYEWPIHYAEGLSLIKELPKVPTRVLEIGAKGAAFSLAALQHGATEAFALDDNETALAYGADLSGHLGHPISVRTADCKQLKSLPVEGKWDLIVLPYSLFTFFDSTEAQFLYIQKLLRLLSFEGHLLIVESSATETNRRFLALRDAIAASPIPIVAPCLWKGNCPALKHGSSPCFAQRPLENKPFMIKEIQRAAKINLSSLKMSYLILGSLHSHVKPLPETLYRIISPPVDTFKGERFFLCGVKGKKTLGTTLKEHPKQSRAFEYLKRGDVIAVENATELDNDLQVTDQTLLQLYAPCDKPLPK